jgi:hypothetical protein
MEAGNPGSRRKRTMLYYLVGVVLPGIILGYMAFRGIRNDQALSERESLRKLETSSRTFFSEIVSDLAGFLDEQIDDLTNHSSNYPDPSILVLFEKDSMDRKKLIIHQLIYLPEELLSNKPGRLKPSPLFRECQRLEFAERRFSDALLIYLDVINSTTDQEVRITALVASARLHKKMDQPEKAKALYERIQKE